ncbi:MAG: hypothetical protein ROO70_21415 [Labrenzia sp.]|jgi:hypothetical protein|uniref:hypothetical protein n=1 Tax=Stappiaceae TaxID=2821832 RepID=UPI001063B46E|nr:hypothetical protein [Labrenzia sp. R4_1]MBO9425180.1 hypothetical protein [Labrenzia sp. R4_1]
MSDDFAKVFSNLNLKDVRVDSMGNIRITNPDIAKQIADMKGAFDADALADSSNFGTCNNTACMAPAMDQLAQRR